MVAQGLINTSTLDRAVGNVLRQKFAAGLFDNNDTLLYVDPVKQAATVRPVSPSSLAWWGSNSIPPEHLRVRPTARTCR